MLKLQPTFNFMPETKTKCGEIFYHSSKDFTIFCTFCQMKSFQFDDFLLHIQNVHLKSKLHKPHPCHGEESKDNLELNVKNETISYGKEEGVLWHNIEQTSNNNLGINVKNETSCDKEEDVSCDIFEQPPSDSSDESWEEEKLKILKKPKRRMRLKRTQSTNNGQADKLQNELNKAEKDVPKTSSNFTKKIKVLEYTCTECYEIFSQKKHLDKHVRELHSGYKCSLCDKRFTRTSHVECHLKTHTTEKKFICPIENCGRGFIDEDYLKRHLEVHTMERNFICKYENCGKAFQTSRRLASHEYTHRIPKKFVCDVCGYGCRSNPQLITHLRVHTGEKPFPCEVCSKPFISKMALQEHMISHLETRPHVCSICNRAFANRRVLVRHSYIHSDEKTFKCRLCDSAFKHPNSLQGHMRHVHREPKLKSA